MGSLDIGCTLSDDAQRLIDMARRDAARQQISTSSNHLLRAICTAPTAAQEYLLEQHVELARVQAILDPSAAEPPQVLEQVWNTARSLTSAPSALTSLHLLAGLLRYHTHSNAVRTLRCAGLDTTRLRNTLISQLTQRAAGRLGGRMQSATPVGEAPRVMTMPQQAPMAPQGPGQAPPQGQPPQGWGNAPPHAPQQQPWVDPSVPGHLRPDHPLNAPNPYLPAARFVAPPPVLSPPPTPVPSTRPPVTPRRPQPKPQRPVSRITPRKSSDNGKKKPGRTIRPQRPSGTDGTRSNKPRKSPPVGLAGRLKGRFGTRKPRRDREALPKPSMKALADDIFGDGPPIALDEMKRQLAEDIERLGPELGNDKEVPSDDAPPTNADKTESKHQGLSPGAAPAVAAPEKRPQAEMTVRKATKPDARNARLQRKLEARYTLDPEVYPFLARLGRNLSLMAIQGQLDDLVGRDSEIARLTDVLNKRRSNNPLLVGPPGVGKTAIVEGLALDMAGLREDEDESMRDERIIVELEMGRLLSGTQLRGSFSERLIGIKDEVAKAKGRIVVFLDELHTWIGAGASGDGGADAAGELKAALARGRFPCIGATTNDEYTRYVESDPAFKRRFQVIEVAEPSPEDCAIIMRGVMPAYAQHHKVTYEDDAIEAAIRFSQRYIPDERLPDKAIGVLDLAGSRARRMRKPQVDRAIVARVVSDQTGVPMEKLLMTDRERFLRMEEILGANLIGHRAVIKRVCEVIRRNHAGFHSGRPIGSFLFLGPTGVGKTELVKVLADFLFRDRNAIVRLDMSEYRESHAVSRLIGAPPGYVGHEHGGQLTEAIRKKPYQIVLLDEVEKSHPEVLNILLQLLDDGRLTDGKGRTINFANTVIIMTSNLGSEYLSAGVEAVTQHRQIGFGNVETPLPVSRELRLTEEIAQNVLGTARGTLSPELWNRIEERVVFGPLTREEVGRIAHLQMRDSARRLAAEREIYIEATEAVYDLLIDRGGYDPSLGARPMRQTLQRLIEVPVSERIISGAIKSGDHVKVDVEKGELVFKVTDR